jgi:integrase
MLHIVLHRALKDAMRMGLAQRNVTEMVHPPRKQKREIHPLDAEQVAAFLAAVSCERLEAFFVLAVTTGIREGELLALRWQDVDLDKGMVRIEQSLMVENGGMLFVEPKTEQTRRKVHLPKAAVYALRKHRIRYLQEAMAIGPDWNPHNLVVTTDTGNPMRHNDVSRHYFK